MPSKQAWKEYRRYLVLFAVFYLFLFVLGAIPLLLRHDVALAEKIRRLVFVTPIILVMPLICAAWPLVVPRLWFWPWNRQNKETRTSE